MATIEGVSSVISTGNAGTVFEHQVGGAFLCLVLTNSYVPIFPAAVAAKVHFQARRIGWKTDDMVIEAVAGGTDRHLIAAQVKRSFTLSETDGDCCKTFLAAWEDFQAKDRFNPLCDALALIVHLGTNRLLRDLGWLLTQARTSTSWQDFEQRREGKGVLNKKSKADYLTIKSILETGTGTSIPGEEIWRFLRVFHLFSYDLTSPGAKDESFIRTLLAVVTIEGDPSASASATWAALVKLAADGASLGASYARSDLPPQLLKLHRSVNATEHYSIVSIRQHSNVILDRVFDASPTGLSFQRTSITDEIIAAASSNQITFIVGSAGSGKSVLAKRFIRTLDNNELTIVFAAEELRVSHIDSVLTNANIGVNWETLRSLLCMQPSKTFLLEGLERLLETDDRSALIDLLRTVTNDPTIRLVITCRDYHAETVERTMLRPSGVTFQRVVIPGLTDGELDEAAKAIPSLEHPLSSPPLRRLLRNPFALARAAEVSWPASSSLPTTEKALRERLWGDIVRKDASPGSGMPNRRASAMTNIALARARSLRPYVEVPQTDHEATHALAVDNLLSFDSAAHQRAAPSHDVFEDWALIEWLGAQFSQFDGDVEGFASSRDAHPALRRAYRKWLHEVIETDTQTANTYLKAVTTSAGVLEYLRDDTMIAVFQSSVTAAFLDTFSASLLENGGELLVRAIHLVRVACKTVSPLAGASTSVIHQWHVPVGSAWPNMLEFLSRNWTLLPSSLYPLTISFLEDWASGVNWATPYPEGSEAAGLLLQRLLPKAKGGWRDTTEKHRVIALITKIPKAAEETFKSLVERRKSLTRRREDPDAEILGELIEKPYNAFAVARDFPQELIDLCLAIWRSKQPSKNDDFYSGHRDIESVFGIDDHLTHRYFPASALQGPFKWLLQSHPTTAIPFIVSLMNDASDYYGKAESPLQYVEIPHRIELTFPDGETSAIWANARLWNAYRATAVMPGVLESALMALEAWLLELIQLDGWESAIQKWLVWILRHSNNVSSIAVVASVCIAHPTKTVDAGLILLSCREFFSLDRQRMVSDHGALAPGGLGYMDREFQKERLASNKLPHRRRDLESLALDVQLISRDKVWDILDSHFATLPPLNQQNDDDRLWRLALSRMDLRKYEATAMTDDGRIQIQMRGPDADVQEVIDRDAPERDRFNRNMSLFLWATNQYERNENWKDKAPEWHERLEQARSESLDPQGEEARFGSPDGGPGITASVCIRDHWDQLLEEEKTWCVEAVIEHVSRPPRSGDAGGEFAAVNPMNGVPACANVLPLVCLKLGPDPAIVNVLIAALLHFNEYTRFEAAKGVSEHVVAQDPRLAAFSTWVIVTNALIWKTFEEQDNGIPYHDRPPFMARIVEAIDQVTEISNEGWYESYPDLSLIAFGSWSERHAARALIHLFHGHAQSPEAFTYFSRLAEALKAWWGLDRRHRGDRVQRDFELEHAAQEAVAEFLLDCPATLSVELSQKLFCAIEKMPDKVAGLLGSMLSAEDGRTTHSNYWQLWSELAEKIGSSQWLAQIDREHPHGGELIRECFLNTSWKEGISTWSRLGDNFRKIDALFDQLPASSFVLKCYTNYLYHIGRDALPGAFALISRKFNHTLGSAIASDTNIRWYLDALISRSIFNDRVKLKGDSMLRGAVMNLLDGLIYAGSSVAFQLRDDFVTPSPPISQTESAVEGADK
jgi:ABC-type dipeptide/oligopeptide/nickel transport system ATPase component